jgi:hypothetical protein
MSTHYLRHPASRLVAYYLLQVRAYHCVQLIQRRLKGVSLAMATDANEVGSRRDPGGSSSYVPANASVALKLRTNQIFVSIESIHGCTEIERLSRIPGAPKSVKGLILFKGEPIPLISFFGGATEPSTHDECLPQREKTDEYAVIFSIKGARFAARVDEPPRICPDKGVLHNAGGNCCYMRRTHLERLFELCIAQANGIVQTKSAPQSANDSEVGSDSHGIEQETTSTITAPCCAT